MSDNPRSGYKNTEIGKIPEEWDIVKLVDVIKRVKQVDPRRHPDSVFVYIDVSGISEDTYKIISSREYLGKNAPHRARKPIRENDIIFATVRPYLKRVAIVPRCLDGEIVSTAFAIIRCIKGVADYRYVFYILLTNRIITILKARQRGSNYPAVSDKDLYNLRIPLPPLFEQQKIADILSTVNDAIQKTDEIIAKTEELKKGLMQKLLTRGVGHTMFKETKIGEIPEEWKIGVIIDFSMTIDSPVQTGPFGAQLHSYDYVDKGVPLILIRNVIGGNIIENDMPRIKETKASQLSRYRLKAGDIIFSRVGSVGRIAVTKKIHDGWLISGQMLRVRLENPQINNEFLGYVISSSWFKKALEIRTVGATRKSINTEILSNLPLVVPPLKEQEKIANILSTVDKKKETEELKKQKLVELKKGLMQVLLTGEVRVKVGDDA